jgi:hypothetical protein
MACVMPIIPPPVIITSAVSFVAMVFSILWPLC